MSAKIIVPILTAVFFVSFFAGVLISLLVR